MRRLALRKIHNRFSFSLRSSQTYHRPVKLLPVQLQVRPTREKRTQTIFTHMVATSSLFDFWHISSQASRATRARRLYRVESPPGAGWGQVREHTSSPKKRQDNDEKQQKRRPSRFALVCASYATYRPKWKTPLRGYTFRDLRTG